MHTCCDSLGVSSCWHPGEPPPIPPIPPIPPYPTVLSLNQRESLVYFLTWSTYMYIIVCG